MPTTEQQPSSHPSTLQPGYYSRNLTGHRAAYLDFVKRILGGERVSGSALLLHKGPVLFLMVEDNFGLYVLTGLSRAVLGRRTAGLLFRPGPALAGQSLRLRFKRKLLQLLRHVPALQTLSIVPTPLDPRIGDIVDGWIHDFQLWDLSEVDRSRIAAMRDEGRGGDPEAMAMLKASRAHAAGRPLLVSLGMQNRSKGIERLAASMREGGTAGWAVLVAGRFDEASATARAEIESLGGLVVGRHLTDGEIEAAYAASSAVWCLYDPAYDQASGILGRAVQLGLPAIVRRGSFSEALCRIEKAPHAAAEGGADLAEALAKLPPQQPGHARDLSARIAAENIARLRLALGHHEEAPG